MPFTTLILAGSRPGTDPLLAGTSYRSKALFPIGGRPMLCHVLDAITAAPQTGRIIVAAQDAPTLASDPGFQVYEDVEWRATQGSIADAVGTVLSEFDGPLFVTTADNVLLTAGMIAQFLEVGADSDVAVGLVERQRVAQAGHSTQRTWLKFRNGQWSGANLFLLGGKQVMPLLKFWKSIEQDRKKGWKIIGAFGPALLVGALLRLLDIHQFVLRAARRFGLSARIVPMEAAEACIDADKPSDIPVIEQILEARQADASAASTASSASLSSSS